MLPFGPRALLAASFLTFAALALALPARQETEWRVLEERMFHLGNDPAKEWPEAPVEPQSQPLELRFEARANEREWLLEVTARDVDNDWVLELNETELARLKKINDELLTARYPVPAGRMKAGENVLRVRALVDPNDDLTVGRVRLAERSLREVEHLGRVEVRVTERGSLAPLPARLTVVGADGRKLDLYYAERPESAVRPGIAYVGDGSALLEIPAGPCTIWASRGMEWSAASATVEVVEGESRLVKLALAREVDTSGWVAADTHIHTLTYSGHGDASVEERMVTLAGEGIELAIATDHNHQTDYRPVQQKLALSPWFTPVVGNEVTTDNGHMNAFPMDPAAPLPPHEETDWKKLVAGIRAKGAKVVILNHPRWPEDGKDPLTKFGFDERTGKNAAGQEFTFDCIEVVNSDSPTSPPRMVLPAWYALLEAGQRFTAIGSSDSHAVGVIVGQGRTYVPSASDDPANIDVDAACRQFLEGRVSVSLGMFATITIDGKGMGERVRAKNGTVEATVTVRHPSWVTPRTLELVVNGSVAATVRLDDAHADDRATEKIRRVTLPLPRADSWIVALAEGDRVTAPFWNMSLPATLALTNPIFASR
ncbi:MAG: CehA/McbA family metallohydrolase [Planctomycetota bacterium]